MIESAEGGFTLLEVALAVAILGVALTAVLTIQTQQLHAYFNARLEARSALLAQYLLTIMEVRDTSPEPGSTSGELSEILQKFKYFGKDNDPSEQEELKGFSYSLTVTPTELPKFGPSEPVPDAFRRIDLVITWGDRGDERYSVVYYIKTKKA